MKNPRKGSAQKGSDLQEAMLKDEKEIDDK